MNLLSPIPGLLRSMALSDGQSLESGAELCVVVMSQGCCTADKTVAWI